MIAGRAADTGMADPLRAVYSTDMTTTRSPAMVKPRLGQVALSNRARIVLAACTAVTLALYLIPDMYWVAYPLVLISTVVHEMGHGVAALLVGGRWADFHMFSDASGYASTWAPDGAARAFVMAGGLCGPAVAGAVFLALGRRPKSARWALGATGAFFALSEILWVRGGFGWMFVGALAAICLVIALKASAEVAQIALIFLATQLALSVYSRSDYLFTKGVTGQTVGASGNHVSDVQGMAQNLGLPYWFWGALCAAFSAAVLLAAAWLYFRPARGPKAPAQRPAAHV